MMSLSKLLMEGGLQLNHTNFHGTAATVKLVSLIQCVSAVKRFHLGIESIFPIALVLHCYTL